MTACLHCGQPLPHSPAADTAGFCCSGCEAAYGLVQGLGLERYYARRSLDPTVRPMRPEEQMPQSVDYRAHQRPGRQPGTEILHLMVDGVQCAACIWLIESVLARQPGVVQARINMTTRRLVLAWQSAATDAGTLVGLVQSLGYRLVPYDPERLGAQQSKVETELLWAMAVAGFSAGNVMLLSVAVWSGHVEGMGVATRDLMHWLSALITMPAIAWSARPFLRSAWQALRHRRTNMDVPISLGVCLATGMSLVETIRSAPHVYFDSAIMLLFFLLVGRYLDHRARGRARASAEHLLTLSGTAVTVLEADGRAVVVPPEQVRCGQNVLVAAGQRVPVDGRVEEGISDLDTSLITGETVPRSIGPGGMVFAGTLNVSAPLRLVVTAVGDETLLAEIVRLMEAAEQGRARYVAIADRVSRLYAPVVHLTALVTFLGWVFAGGVPWQPALLNAIAVLIITCPCALALAVPVVQVVASGRLMRQGILLKTATALERLAVVDTVVFDKTGTLTEGAPIPELGAISPEEKALLAALAGNSRHPLARALVAALPRVPVATGVREIPGAGLEWEGPEGTVRLGSRRFAGPSAPEPGLESDGPEIWLARPGNAPLRVGFHDALRPDAEAVVVGLRQRGLALHLLSGDRQGVVAAMATRLGIAAWQGECTPAAKVAALEALKNQGRRVLMVGDGLNDAPALAAAWVSVSPAGAADVSQTAADVVFQGQRLEPIREVLAVAEMADRLVRQNFMLAFLYNVVTVPLAMAGQVTPLIAALAMSSSSVVVIGNALRLGRAGNNR